MRRRTSNALTALGAAVVIVLLGAGTPHSQTTDMPGEHHGSWNTSLDGPLFDSDIRWVPGDTRTAEFDVSNDTDDDGSLSIRVDSADSVMSDVFSVGLGGRMGECAEVSVPARSTRNVAATVHMSGSATENTQTRQARLDVVLQWGDGGATSPCAPSFDDAEDGNR